MALPIQSAPTYKTVLPSSGKEIEYRPFLVKEQKVLVMAKEGADQEQVMSAIIKMIDACTFGKENISKLPMMDLEWLFIKVRAISVGETSKLVLTCMDKDCKGTAKVDLDLEAIQPSGAMPESDTVMLTDDMGVKLRVPSVKDIDGLTKMDETQQSMEIVKRCITSVFDADEVYPMEDVSQKELDEFFDSLTFKQLDELGMFFDSLPKLTHEVKYKCGVCQTENTRLLQGIQSFF